MAGGGPAPTLAYRGELSVGGLTWLRNRAYDPASRSFLSPDPLPGIVATPSAANPYHYAANDPVGAADPFGLRPMTEADLAAYREATAGNGLVDNLGDAWDATTDWVSDNWEYIAAGALIVGGVVIMCTGVGGPIGAAMIGGALLSGGISAGSQRALTGEVNWSQVGVDMAIGAVAGGTGAGLATAGMATRIANPVLRGVAVGGAEGFVSGTGYQVVNYAQTGEFDPTAIARDTLLGGGMGGAGAHLTGVRAVDPMDIRFSQTSVNDAQEIIDSMGQSGWRGRPIDVVRMSDGGLTTVDNTRVLAAGYTDTPVQTRVHAYDDPIDPSRVDTLVSRKNVPPTTWGEGVENRIGRQNATYRNRYPQGSEITGWNGS